MLSVQPWHYTPSAPQQLLSSGNCLPLGLRSLIIQTFNGSQLITSNCCEQLTRGLLLQRTEGGLPPELESEGHSHEGQNRTRRKHWNETKRRAAHRTSLMAIQ